LTATAAGLFSRFAWAASANARLADESSGFLDLKRVGPEKRVLALAYSPGEYRVTTADGDSAIFLEANLRFKVDSSSLGPRPGAPVILPSGTEGDRMLVLFASPEEVGSFVSR
jgi:hypothetical protein